jgi:UDP-glucose 4-epimerase
MKEMKNKGNNMRVLIVGINGFLGRTIAKECLRQGIIVEGIYHRNINNIPSNLRVYPVSNIGSIRQIYDTIFIVAAVIPYPGLYVSELNLIKTNIRLPLQIALQFPKSFIVFASSVSVYGNPLVSRITERTQTREPNKYGMTKFTAEILLTKYHKKSAIIRFSSLYGKNMYPNTFIPRIMKEAEKKGIINLLGDGQRMQDYLHVNDAAVLCLKAAKSKIPGKYLGVYGTSHTNLTVAEYVCYHFSDCQIRYAGIDMESSYEYDASYTRKRLDFNPSISLKQGIKKML